jgi:hypothetical protein
VKFRLLDETPHVPALLLGAIVRLPTGGERRGLGAADVDVGALVAVAKTFDRLTLTWNAGHAFLTEGRRQSDWTLAASVEYRLTAAWSVVAEAVGTVSTDGGTDTAVVRAGAVWTLTERLRLDGAVGTGFTRDSPALVLTLGISVGF